MTKPTHDQILRLQVDGRPCTFKRGDACAVARFLGEVVTISSIDMATARIELERPDGSKVTMGCAEFADQVAVRPINPAVAPAPRKHSLYFRWVGHLQWLDIYRIFQLFNVTDSAIQHAVKKLMAPGGRGAGKDFRRDVQEAIDALQRRLEMLDEDEAAAAAGTGAP